MTKTFSVYRSSAGSGKTRTLAKAYLGLALQFRANYFKHILAVTFTNKASQEMKDRILAYLDEFAQGKPGSLADELREELGMDAQTFRQHSQETQSELLHHYDHFSISTIDAFFQKVIRSFTREAGLVGDYRLEVDQDAVLEEVIDNLIDELGSNKELTDWVVDFARENLENERSWDVRYSLIEFAREIFREEFKEIEDEVNLATAQPGFFRDLKNHLWHIKHTYLARISAPAREALAEIESRGWGPEDFKHGRNSGLLTFFKGFAWEKNIAAQKSPRPRIREDFTDPQQWPGRTTPHKAAILAAATTTLVPKLKQILDVYDHEFKLALSAEVVLRNLYVFGLIADISRKLREYKEENNLMLLADAPKFLNGVIRDSDTPFIYEKVGSFYRNYLIDEFQDTSGLQWQNFQPLIINSLDQGYPSLVVGDVKQAIYRWRGGDLGLLQDRITPLIGADRVETRVLDKNFRSAPEIVAFNNALFRNAAAILARDIGSSGAEAAYEGAAQQVAGTTGGYVQIQFLKDDPAEDAAGEQEIVTWKDHALKQVPLTLEELQRHGVPLKDIAILVRRNEEGQRIAAFLLQYKSSPEAKPGCAYDVVSNESLRVDGAATVNLLLSAMRYLVNTDDAIARAQLAYEYTRLHEPGRNLAEVFAVSNQSIFENNLPAAYAREKAALKKLSLVELTETLIAIFGLGAVTGELVYLQAFEDLVLEFSSREKNDLGAFLEWWEVNKQKKSIQLSGEVDAVQILTIHKSKGLQFKFVIIPFCSWSRDHEAWRAPNLWVRAPGTPLERAGFVPVKYGTSLNDTYFSEYFAAEKAKIQLDNLNLLYVALTRAAVGLFVSAPAPEVRSSTGSIARLLYESIQAEPLGESFDQGSVVWRAGSLSPRPSETKPGASALELRSYPSFPWREKLVVRKAGAFYFQDDGVEKHQRLIHGVHMHAVLSRMEFADNLDEMLVRIRHEGLITEQEKGPLRKSIDQLLENPNIKSWFARAWDVRTEVPVLLPGGEEVRFDRLMLKDRKAIVVDFKTGARRKQDEKQVVQYMVILRQMNFHEVEGYLLYLRENEIVEVTAGVRSKIIQKKVNRDQLDLGL